jgi:SEFIR domain
VDRFAADEHGPTERPTRVFLSSAHDPDSPIHGHTVRRFWEFLRSQGIDARLDVGTAEERQDWALWMADQVREADHIVLIASSPCRTGAQGQTTPPDGRDARWEARSIRDASYADQDRLDRFLPVVLPGQTIDGVPDFLAPATSTVYYLDEFTVVGVESLLRLLTGQSRTVLPTLGPQPTFPTARLPQPGDNRPDNTATADRSMRTRYHETVKRIAPGNLLDRAQELADLARFCVDPQTAGHYRWWRAAAWSGKSALLSWFVLHPPLECRSCRSSSPHAWPARTTALRSSTTCTHRTLPARGLTRCRT